MRLTWLEATLYYMTRKIATYMSHEVHDVLQGRITPAHQPAAAAIMMCGTRVCPINIQPCNHCDATTWSVNHAVSFEWPC